MSGFANRGPQDIPAGSIYSLGPQLFDPTVYALGGGHLPADAVTAHAGGGRASATKLPAAINRITVCATIADSVVLPAATGGQFLVLNNGGAASAQVFAANGTNDTINGVAAATGVALAANKSAVFCSSLSGVWFWVLSA